LQSENSENLIEENIMAEDDVRKIVNSRSSP
jgi:hypothetical protein